MRPTMLITGPGLGRAVLTFPFSRWLIEHLKREVPAYARSYDPATKRWAVEHPYLDVAARLMLSAFPDADIVDERTAGATGEASADPGRETYAVLHLLPSAPPELVEAAYKCLARLHHPDTGGDHRTMQQINTAVAEIRQRIA